MPPRKMMRAIDLLPVELINEILLRLPRKSFTRFRVVCKSWESLITSPQFISSYYYRLTVNRNSLFLSRIGIGRRMTSALLQDDGDQIILNSKLKFPDLPEIDTKSVVGTCNGLVCVRCRVSEIIILWNPFIGKHIVLPAPTRQNVKVPSVLGFFTASDVDDLKVLRIPGYNYHSDKTNSVVEVYSINSGVWQRMQLKRDLPAYGSAFDWTCMPLFTKDAVHWIATRGCNWTCYILALHVRNEVAYGIELPEHLANDDHFNRFACYYLTVLGEWFTVIEVRAFGPCNIWVMKEYGVKDSWINLYNIEMPNGGWVYHVAWFKNDAQVLFFSQGELLSYDLNTKEMKKLGIRIPDADTLIYNYKPSLMLL